MRVGIPSSAWFGDVAEGVVGVAVPILERGWVADRAAGRSAASSALVRSGAQCRDIGRADDGRPLWPTGWTGSISHGAGVAVAAVRRVTASWPRSGIGVDVEVSHALPLIDAEAVLTADELAVVRSGALPDATVLWSAKEAAFKAWSHAAEGLAGVDPRDIVVAAVPLRTELGVWSLQVVAEGALLASLSAVSVPTVVTGRSVVRECVLTLVATTLVPTPSRPRVPSVREPACHHRVTPDDLPDLEEPPR